MWGPDLHRTGEGHSRFATVLLRLPAQGAWAFNFNPVARLMAALRPWILGFPLPRLAPLFSASSYPAGRRAMQMTEVPTGRFSQRRIWASAQVTALSSALSSGGAGSISTWYDSSSK
jgi:hypothetical protein